LQTSEKQSKNIVLGPFTDWHVIALYQTVQGNVLSALWSPKCLWCQLLNMVFCFQVSMAKHYWCAFQKASWKLLSFSSSQFAHLLWYWLLTFNLYMLIRAGPVPQSTSQS